MSRALRDQAVCRSKLFIELGDNSVSMIGVDRSALFGARKLKLLSYGLFGSVVVVECVKRVFECVAVGKGVRERRGNVSTNGVEPNGVGVLLRGLSRRHCSIDRMTTKKKKKKKNKTNAYRSISMLDIECRFHHFPTRQRKGKKRNLSIEFKAFRRDIVMKRDGEKRRVEI